MIIEIKQEKIRIGGKQLYKIIVDGEARYENLTYEELCEVTIGELDRVEEGTE
jgi:hypothetical protein